MDISEIHIPGEHTLQCAATTGATSINRPFMAERTLLWALTLCMFVMSTCAGWTKEQLRLSFYAGIKSCLHLPALSLESSQPAESTKHTYSLQSAMLGAAEALGLVIAVLKPTCPSKLFKLARAGWTTEQLRQYIASGQLQPSISLLGHPPQAAPATAGRAAAASWTAFQNACKHPDSAQVPIRRAMYSQSSPSQCTYKSLLGRRLCTGFLSQLSACSLLVPVNHEAVIDRHGLPMRTTEGSETMCCRLSQVL